MYSAFWTKTARFGLGLPDGAYIFKPKIPFWVNLGGPWNGKGCCVLWSFGIFNGLFVI
jgi:hypothetical protein